MHSTDSSRVRPPRKTRHPEYAFWHLQSDRVWAVQRAGSLPKREGKSFPNPSRRDLLRLGVEGGFELGAQLVLERDSSLVRDVALQRLSKSFPESLHQPILAAVGLDLDGRLGSKARSPQFRVDALRAYENRCSVCGYALSLGSTHIGLEAARIKWVQAGGPDRVRNGLCLCALITRS